MILISNPVGGPAPISILGGLEMLLDALGGLVGEASSLTTATTTATAAAMASSAVAAATAMPAAPVELRNPAGSQAIRLLVIQDLLEVAG